MKIIEARDGFINFEAEERVYLSSFVQAIGMDKSYIAQVNQMKRFGKILIGSARILFLYNGHELMNYDRTLPSRDSELEIFPLNIIQASISTDSPVIVGKTLDNSKNIFMDISAFNKKTLISFDDRAANNIIVSNLSKQFEHFGQNTIILDMSGIINEKKYIAGKDFKLPLDASILEFMFKSCLNDATADSKLIIAEVFKDLAEYSKTVPFVPFGVLKSVVDEMVDKQHIFKLFILKNRLANFDKLGYFATEKSEVENLETILSSKSAVIDLSKLNSLFQNKFLEYIYTKINPANTQVVLEASNTISKKNLKTVIVDSEVSTTFVVNPKFQYLKSIKDMFKNFIIEPTVVNNEIFKVYYTFLSSMQRGMYLITGENVNFIPMVSKIQEIDDTIETANLSEKTPDRIDADTDIDSDSEPSIDDEMFDELSQQEDNLADGEEIEVQEDVLSTEEIIAEIDEKSNNVIENISETVDQPVEINLFGESGDAEDDISEEADEVANEDLESKLEQSSSDIKDELLTNIESDSIKSDEEELQEKELTNEVSGGNDDFNDNSSVDIEAEELLDIRTEDGDSVLKETELVEEPSDDAEIIDGNTLLESTSEELLADNDSDVVFENVAESDELQDIASGDENILSDNIETSDIEPEVTEQIEDGDITIDLTEDEEDLLKDEPLQTVEDAEMQKLEPEMDILEPSILPLDSLEYNNQGFEELEELSSEESNEDDIIVNLENESDFVEIDEEVDRQIVEDVDKVFTTMKNDDELEEISDSDLDLIDELNSDEDELEEYNGELEEISDSQIEDGILDQPKESIIPPRQPHQETNEILEKKEANTPIVPVYDADIPQEDMVVSDTIQQGDSVVHAKYGNGVVEKMIKYGTKTLFSINFENIGRRLLDPTLTEIKKI